MRLVARAFGGLDAILHVRQHFPELGDAGLELLQFFPPRFHFSGGEVELHRKAPMRQLRVTLGALALPGERTHLRLHLTNQIVESL